jgi:hypothetical protein
VVKGKQRAKKGNPTRITGFRLGPDTLAGLDAVRRDAGLSSLAEAVRYLVRRYQRGK